MVLLHEERQKEGIAGEVVGLGMLCWVQVGRMSWRQGIIGLCPCLESSVKSAVRTDWILHEYALVHHFNVILNFGPSYQFFL